jgi:hypothetical protein
MEVIFGVASEAKFNIFNDKNERILHATESKSNHFYIHVKNLFVFEKLRHFANASVVQLDDVLHFAFLIIIIRYISDHSHD